MENVDANDDDEGLGLESRTCVYASLIIIYMPLLTVKGGGILVYARVLEMPMPL